MQIGQLKLKCIKRPSTKAAIQAKIKRVKKAQKYNTKRKPPNLSSFGKNQAKH